MPQAQTETANSLSGRTLRWTFDDGPMAGATYEHTFEPDGGVAFRKVETGASGTSGTSGTGPARETREKRSASFELAPGVHVVSYLGDAGFTLTVAMNFDTARLVGFASNEKEWHPVTGTLEIVR